MRIGASRAFGLKLRIFLLREAVDRRSSADINEAAVRLVTGLLEVARAGQPIASTEIVSQQSRSGLQLIRQLRRFHRSRMHNTTETFEVTHLHAVHVAVG